MSTLVGLKATLPISLVHVSERISCFNDTSAKMQSDLNNGETAERSAIDEALRKQKGTADNMQKHGKTAKE